MNDFEARCIRVIWDFIDRTEPRISTRALLSATGKAWTRISGRAIGSDAIVKAIKRTGR
jgi:hypothetical protein